MNVNAGQHAIVSAFGDVTQNVTATAGDAVVLTWGNINGITVDAGDSVYVFTGNNIAGPNPSGSTNITLQAANDAFLQSLAGVTTVITTTGSVGRDLGVWSAGSLAGNAEAGRDVAISGMGPTTIIVDAGQDAFVFSRESYLGQVQGGRDAFLLGMNWVNAQVIGGQDAGIYAVEAAQGAVTGGRYASLVTWDSIGPTNVSGPDGAATWSYGDTNWLTIDSANGPVAVAALGSIWSLNVTNAGEWVSLASVGDMIVNGLTAFDNVHIFTFGDFSTLGTGSLNSTAANLHIRSEGQVNANANAFRDVTVSAFSNITGNYTTGRDIAAVAYGSFNAAVNAGRDIVSVTSVGDLQGSLLAAEEIIDVMSYGDVLSGTFIMADDITHVAARGDIAGTHMAGTTYDTVDPIDALKKVGHLVRSIHCKDATWAPAEGRGRDCGQEVPLGEGDVGMETYLRTLNEIGYTGPLTIEREIAHDRERQKADIGQAVRLLEELRSRVG